MFSRTSAAYAYNGAGNIVSFGVDEPRQDYDPETGVFLGTLLEPASTNLFSYSVAHTETWILNGGRYSNFNLNALGIFPGLNSSSLGNTYHRVNHPNVSLTGGVTYAMTVWFRPGSSPNYRVAFRTSSGNQTNWGGSLAISGPIAQGAAGTISMQAQRRLQDGSIMVQLLFTANQTTDYSIGVGPYSPVSGHDIIILGMQLEQGNAPSAYIPTNGSAATRAADVPRLIGLRGAHHILAAYGDGTIEKFPPVSVSEGYWPILSKRHVKSMTAYPA